MPSSETLLENIFYSYSGRAVSALQCGYLQPSAMYRLHIGGFFLEQKVTTSTPPTVVIESVTTGSSHP